MSWSTKELVIFFPLLICVSMGGWEFVAFVKMDSLIPCASRVLDLLEMPIHRILHTHALVSVDFAGDFVITSNIHIY